MAFDELGLSFLPPGGAGEAAGPGGNRLEDILQVLSFRLPNVQGARPIAPQALLEAQGGNNPLAAAMIRAVLQKVLQGSPMGQGGMDPGAGGNPLSKLMAPMGGFPGGTAGPNPPMPPSPMPPGATPPVALPGGGAPRRPGPIDSGGPIGGGPIGGATFVPHITPGQDEPNFVKTFRDLSGSLNRMA